MEVSVVLASRSGGIGNGLSYAATGNITPGSLVKVPLRNSHVEGVVLQTKEKAMQRAYELKDVQQVLGEFPLLPPALVKTAVWMAGYYCCTLRHVLQVMLPPPPWSLLLPISVTTYAPAKNVPTPRGKRQLAVIEYLKDRQEPVSAYDLQEETGATGSVLKAMAGKGMLIAGQRTEEVVLPQHGAPNTPALNATEKTVMKSILADTRPSLLIDSGGINRAKLFAALAAGAAKGGHATIVLTADVVSAERLRIRLEAELGIPVSLALSAMTPLERRRQWRALRTPHPHVVVGTRTALFSPLPDLGLVIVDDEHEWTYKNEQAPRYHARHTAEVLCKSSGAKLVLCSATPSLESWKHAVGISPRFSLVHAGEPTPGIPAIRVIDLAQEQSGKDYPLSTALIGAIEKRLKAGEQSVLLMNRRGSATGLLCLDCRRMLLSKYTTLPLTVHMMDGKPYLVDQHAEEVAPVPEVCPDCRSHRLHAVGAGTQRVEQTLKRLFPKARIARVDKETLEDESIGSVLKRAEGGDIDILVGTQPVVKAAELPNVTLGSILVADIGLSLPHFRAGERVVQHIGSLLRRVPEKPNAEVILQTFRPDTPEIALSAKRALPEYLDAEIRLRAEAGYPPVTQMIRLIVRTGGEPKARELVEQANKANPEECTAWAAAPLPGKRGGKWSVFLKGKSPRTALQHLDTRGVSIDVDPIDWE